MKNITRVIAEPGKQEILIEREFEAPREIVFKAFTDPDLYVQWIGPEGFTTKLEIFEPLNGGSWRFKQKDPDDNEFAFHGVYHEVTAPIRIIGTFEWDDLPEKGHVILQTTLFEELSLKRTKLIDQSVFQNVEDRDGMMASDTDMEAGIDESYHRLDEVLKKIQE